MSLHPALFAVSSVGAVCKIIPVGFIAFDQFHDELTSRQQLYTHIPFLLFLIINSIPMSNVFALRRRRSAMRGFTLIEIMVVVVIMGILAALVVPKLMGRTDDARIIAARQDISTIMQAMKLYRLDNQRYPTTEQGLQALTAKPTTGPAANGWKTGGYIDKLPKDPWGNPYQFLSPGVKGEVDVFSLGADGQPGGAGNDADIGSWDL
jgi:general secretion pathway protein G